MSCPLVLTSCDVEEMTTNARKLQNYKNLPRRRREGCRTVQIAQPGLVRGIQNILGLGPRGCKDTSTSRRRILRRRRKCAKREATTIFRSFNLTFPFPSLMSHSHVKCQKVFQILPRMKRGSWVGLALTSIWWLYHYPCLKLWSSYIG